MTYIDYLNAFNQWLESNPLPGNAQLLFFRLLNVFNRAGWSEYVQVDTLRLMLMSDSKSEKTARAARDKLVEAGFISYRKGKKGAPNAYRLTLGAKNNREKFTVNNYPESYPENAPKSYPESYPENDLHIKNKNKTKKKTITSSSTPACDEELSRVMTLFLDKINATPSMMAIEELKGYTEDLGADVVCYALNKSLDEKKTAWSYIKGILKNYSREGITSLEAVRQAEQEFEAKKSVGAHKSSNTKIIGATQEDLERMKKTLERIRKERDSDESYST